MRLSLLLNDSLVSLCRTLWPMGLGGAAHDPSGPMLPPATHAVWLIYILWRRIADAAHMLLPVLLMPAPTAPDNVQDAAMVVDCRCIAVSHRLLLQRELKTSWSCCEQALA